MVCRRMFLTGAAGLAVAGAARAQTPVDPHARLMSEGLYLPQYLDLIRRADGGDAFAGSILSQFAAFVGDEVRALPASPRTTPTPDLTGAVAEDAVETIVRAARDARIVILNESHSVSGQRAFAGQVLKALRPLGFDTFAAETFAAPIRRHAAGDPLTLAQGFYLADPVFAEAVRDAAALGYRMIDYEMTPEQAPPPDADRDAAVDVRERAQAANLIANALSARPDARVFVWCGYSHAQEAPEFDPAGSGRALTWFAARLKAETGIDPLTIEQSLNWPAADPAHDRPHVAAVQARFAPTRPIVVSHEGRAVTDDGYGGRMDLSVFHPRWAPVGDRPGWLAADPDRRAATVTPPAWEGAAALLQARRPEEGPGGIPADQMLLRPGQTRAVLYLKPGRYQFRLERPDGADPAFGEIEVKA